MTSNVTDSKLTHFFKWQADVNQRVLKESLDPDAVMAAVQPIINKTSMAAEVANDPFGRFDIQPDGSFKLKVRINRTQTPTEVFKGITSHKQYFNGSVVAEMPLGIGEEMTLHFFPIKKQMTCREYQAALESRALKPDPMAQAAWNQANPDFADEYPNGTQWKNKDGNFCYAFWSDWDVGRRVNVRENSNDWSDGWFACGVSK